MKLRTAWFGLQLSDTDVLSVGAYLQKYLGYVLQDMFGTTAAQYTGMTVTPGTGFTVNVSGGRLYQQQAAIASQWGSTPTGLGPDATTITKQGALETALANWPSGTSPFVAPGSGTNFYTIQAICVDQDINPTGRTFTPSPNVETSQLVTTDRVTAVILTVKGPSTSSPPAPDAGNTAIATIAIPAGATMMLSGYITQTTQYPGTAGILASGSFVQASPTGSQSGFIHMAGNITSDAALSGASASVSGTAVFGGLLTASTGITANGSSNLNAKVVVGTLATSVVPLVVNGAFGGGQTANLIKTALSPGGTVLFTVDPTGAIGFGNPQAFLQVLPLSTNLVPASATQPFNVSNAANNINNFHVADAGGISARPNGATSLAGVLPTLDYAAGGASAGERIVKFKFSIVPGASSITVSINTWVLDGRVVPIAAFAAVFDDGLSAYDTNHWVKKVSYNPGTTQLTITLDSVVVGNNCPIVGYVVS